MKERTDRHSAPGYALRSVAAEGRGKKSTLSKEVFSLDHPDHLMMVGPPPLIRAPYPYWSPTIMSMADLIHLLCN